MERVHVVFTCVGLRVRNDGIEVKFTHDEDIVILQVASDVNVALGHKYVLSMKPVKDDAE